MPSKATVTDIANPETADVIAADAVDRLDIPAAEDFLVGSYRTAKNLTNLAHSLREEYGLPSDYRLQVVWRKKGGATRTGKRIAKATVVSDLAQHFSGADVVIWVAADNVADEGLTLDDVKRELFHVLCSIQLEEKSLKPLLMPPDFAAYRKEIEVFGLWKASLREAADVFQQAKLAL